MTLLVANAERLAHEALAAGLRPPEPIDFLAFAERHVVISDSPLGDRYVRSQFPFFDEILRALSPSDSCRTVTLCASAQIGKTTLANVFACGSLVMGKGNVLYVLPTEDAGRRWSRMKLMPMVRATPILRENFPSRSRDAADSVMYKERRDGLATLLITGANSPAALSQVTIHTQVQDDVSKWPTDNTAGDPEIQAELQKSCDRVCENPQGLDAADRGLLPRHQEFRARKPGNALCGVSALLDDAGVGAG